MVKFTVLAGAWSCVVRVMLAVLHSVCGNGRVMFTVLAGARAGIECLDGWCSRALLSHLVKSTVISFSASVGLPVVFLPSFVDICTHIF